MNKLQEMLKSEKLYKMTWNVMISTLIIASFMLGILSASLIPVEFSSIYLTVLFLLVLVAALSAMFYYVLRILKTEKKVKKQVYYKRKK